MRAKQCLWFTTTESRARFCASKMHLNPGSVGCCPFKGGGSVVVYSLFYVHPIVCGSSVFVLCFVMHYVVSNLVFQSF